MPNLLFIFNNRDPFLTLNLNLLAFLAYPQQTHLSNRTKITHLSIFRVCDPGLYEVYTDPVIIVVPFNDLSKKCPFVHYLFWGDFQHES